MKIKSLLIGSLLLMPLLVKADTIGLITGTPGDNQTSPATGPSPNLDGLLLTFSDLTTSVACQGGDVTACPAFNPSTYASEGVTISSPDGLVVYPFSVQSKPSNPNELFDNSSDGSANITIALSFGTTAIGVGIADSDLLAGNPVPITLQALGLGGVDLGSPFTVTTPETNPDTAGNGYWAVTDNNPNIYGLEIETSATGQGGLAIADVQIAPEPSGLAFVLAGILGVLGFFRLRRSA